MISTTGYTLNPETNQWKQGPSGTQGNNKVDSDHSERKIFSVLKAAPVYLIVQNAFPCSKCHTWFLNESQKYPVVFKVTENQGNYSADHGLGQKTLIPQILYYYKGACKYVSIASRGNDAPPVGFPAFPDITGY